MLRRQGLAVHLVAQQDVRVHGLRHGEGTGEVLLHGQRLAAAGRDDLLPFVVPKENHLHAVVPHPRLLQDRRQRRAGPTGVEHAAAEDGNTPVARAFEGEVQVSARHGLDLVQAQVEPLPHRARDFETVGISVDSRLRIVAGREELVHGRNPRFQAVPVQQHEIGATRRPEFVDPVHGCFIPRQLVQLG